MGIKTVLAIAMTFSLCAPAAMAQQRSRALPQAGFGSHYGAGELPGAGGVHLHEGLDRNPGAQAQVYDPRDPDLGGKLVRWESRHMPLKVWISPGLQLRPEPLAQIMKERPTEVLQALQSNPQSLVSLPTASRWKPEMSTAAAHGIEQWRELEAEGVVSFVFVEEPWGANILVFWTDMFLESSGPGGASVHGNTSTSCVDVNTVRQKEMQMGQPVKSAPVVIEMQAHDDLSKLQAETAHEFGHALGIKAHSPYRQDIMYVNRIVPVLSASDKATLRWLYKQPPQFVFLPPPVPDVSAIARRPSGGEVTGGGEEAGTETPVYKSGSGYKISPLSAGRPDDDSQDKSRPAGDAPSGQTYRNTTFQTFKAGETFPSGDKKDVKLPEIEKDRKKDVSAEKSGKKKKKRKGDDAQTGDSKPASEDDMPEPVRDERPTDGY